MRKGISPIIAAVLLIAIAISIGILLSSWATHWVFSGISDPSLTCGMDTDYIIESASFNETGLNKLKIKVTNKGNLEIYGFGIEMDNGTRIVRFDSDSNFINQSNINNTINITNRLGREQSLYLFVNLTNETLNYTEFGATLRTVKVLNDACDTVSSPAASVTVY
jgi:flagellin-like protein